MEENLELNRLVKSALESREPFRFVPPHVVRRRAFLRWGVPSLLAASLALAAVLHSTLSAPTDRVADAIRLLAAADGIDLDDECVSSADLLLAWQDAPCWENLQEL